MFAFRITYYNLRGNYILTLHVRNTTTYGFRSFSCHVFKQQNSLPDNLPTLEKSKFLLNVVFYFILAISFKYCTELFVSYCMLC